MTFRLPMFLAASLVLASHAAYASSTPTNTDEIRALIASREPASPPLLTAAPEIVATNTDDVRALVAGLEPASPARSHGSANVISTNTDEVRALYASLAPASPALSTGSTNVVATNTDEVRALFGRAPATQVVRSSVASAAAESSRGDSRTVACPQSCPCHHG